MAFNIGIGGNILQDFKNSLTEALGIGSPSPVTNKGEQSSLTDKNLFGIERFDEDHWQGNAYRARADWLRYGFAIVVASGDTFLLNSEPFYLDVPPQSINQKEIFSTHVQATRKGVIVESEGVVFKDIVITGTTGIFPGERGGSNTPKPNLSSLTSAPKPVSGVDPSTGRSKKNSVPQISGYEEFQRLRQFFLSYAKQKVDSKGQVFFAFLNEKDEQYLIVEPLEFTMERSARSPLNYNYRIVLKAIAPTSELIKQGAKSSDKLGILDQIINLSNNVSASLAVATEIINASSGLLVNVTQALDSVFLTPLRQVNLALSALNRGTTTALSLPGTLLSNSKQVDKNRLAVAEKLGQTINTASSNSSVSPKTKEPVYNSLGEIINTATGDNTVNSISILNPDGSLKNALTPQEFSLMKDIQSELENDPNVPLPRSFVSALKINTTNLINDFSDSLGLGSSQYSDILGRTVTQTAPPLLIPSDDQILLLGTLQNVSAQLNKIMSNNEFFQADADQIFTKAQESYGNISNIRRPDFAREVTIEDGDTLERIALREYGDALRWVDIIIINNLKYPYISQISSKNVKKPGDKILIGNV